MKRTHTCAIIEGNNRILRRETPMLEAPALVKQSTAKGKFAVTTQQCNALACFMPSPTTSRIRESEVC